MNKFQYAEKINANTKLSFANKAIINQIISFQLNNQKFHGTDEYLASTWGVSTRTIKRQISDLKGFNLITVELERKKHTNGEGNWYNKRYITINLEALSDFLNINNQVESEPKLSDSNNTIQEIKPTATIEEIMPEIEAITSNDEYDYDNEQQEAWFNQIAGLEVSSNKNDVAIVVDKSDNTIDDEIKNKLSKLLKADKIEYNHKYRTQAFVKGSITKYNIEDIIELYLK